ncbi:hypothetical protein [Paraliobacillus salinarum]|uniref:hypothetical protein n=1 Tax=Paraliobacillus salinarum TaxID=1158996 RepID=UPI0015F753AD|nr:hypothetical protein [Paraliobacillus salinarum]
MAWTKKESNHYIFHYHIGSLAEKDIEEIINIQENCYDVISNCLNVEMKQKIHYFLCETPTEVGELFGDNEPCNGCAKEPNEVFAVYNSEVKCIGFHEDAHLISYKLSVPPQTFLREGLAMFFDKVSLGIPQYMWIKYFIDHGLYVKVEDLVINKNFYKYSDLVTYPIAGAFVEYLILKYGMEKFKAFYCSVNEDFNKCFSQVFKISVSESNMQFINYINCLGYNDTITDIIKNEIQDKNIIGIT